MNIARWATALFITLMIPGLLVTGAYAMTVTAGTGQVQAGAITQIPVVIDQSPANMGYYNISVSMSDQTVARITRVTFPGWANWLTHNSSVPSGSVYFHSTVLSSNSLMPATEDLTLATLTVEGLKDGTISINIDKAYLQWDGGSGNAILQAGTLQVGGTSPTVTVTSPTVTSTSPTVTVTSPTVTSTSPTVTVTSPTVTSTSPTVTVTSPTVTSTSPTVTVTSPTVTSTSPTVTVTSPTVTSTSPTVTVTATVTIPVTTGQVYFSTTPQGAAIIIDGVPTNAVTPSIMAVPVGTHQAVFRLSGYNDLQASFTSQKGSMTSVSRRLSPGSGVITTTTGTPVVTTTMTTTITTVPTSVQPTNPGSWTSRIKWPSWLSRYLPTGWR